MTEEPRPSPQMKEWRQRLEGSYAERPFTTREAGDLGIGPTGLHRLRASGLIHAGLRGTYHLDRPPDEIHSRAAEVVKAIPGSVIARRTSARLLGEDARTPAEAGTELPIECIVHRGRSPSALPNVLCYQADIGPEDVTWIGQTPLTTPARTAADLLRYTAPHMALACVDQMLRSRIVTSQQILRMLHRWPGQRNVRQARDLVAAADPGSESYGESWLRLRILNAGFPRPQAQIPIQDDRGNLVYRLDLGWPALRLAVEYDGEEFHGERQAVADAHRREVLLNRYGWTVIGVGRGEVLGNNLALERGIGELLGLEPRIRRRTW